MNVVRDDIFSGILFVNHGDNGWSEIYKLAEADFDSAKATFLIVVDARSLILAAGCSIVWACVRQHKGPRPQLAILPAPIDSLKKPDTTEYWGPVHTDFQGLHLAGETPEGHYANRCLRGLADDEMFADRWIRNPFTVPAGPVVRPATPGTATKAELFAYALATIRDKTIWASPRRGAPPGHTRWETDRWDTVYVRGVMTEDVGRNWLPVSWEAAEWDVAPSFGPCGCAVMVVRSTYEAPCKFYSDGPAVHIRWYVALPDAAILPYPSIFWPLSEDLGFANTYGIAESTGKTNRQWTPGYGWSAAPGIFPTGPPEAFLGLMPSPYGVTMPTPVPLRVACDMPTPVPIKFDDDPLSASDSDVVWVTADAASIELIVVAARHVKLRAKGITVKDASGAPSYDDIRELQVDGLELTQPAAKKAKLKNLAPKTYSLDAATLHVLPPFERVGDVLTATVHGAFPTSLVNSGPFLNELLLVRYVINTADRGIYVLTDVGANDPGGRPWVLTRSAIMDTATGSDLMKVASPQGLPLSLWSTGSGDAGFRLDYRRGWKDVWAVSTAALPPYTREYLFNPGPPPGGTPSIGPHRRLTAVANGDVLSPIFDDASLTGLGAAYGFVLVRDIHVSDPGDEGLYVIEQLGDAGKPWVLTSYVHDNEPNAQFHGFLKVTAGTLHQQSVWQTDLFSTDKIFPAESLSPDELAEVLALI